jgi:hypothetical protein
MLLPSCRNDDLRSNLPATNYWIHPTIMTTDLSTERTKWPEHLLRHRFSKQSEFLIKICRYSRRHFLHTHLITNILRGCIQNIPDWRWKIIKFTIRPIGRHQPRSSSLPHVDTGHTVSSIFGKLPEVVFCQCQALFSAIRPGSPQWYQSGVLSRSILFLEIERTHRVQNQKVWWVGDDSHLVFRQKLLSKDGSVRRGVVVMKQPGLFSPKFGVTSSHVFTQSSRNIAVEPGIHGLACWDRCFALPHCWIDDDTSPEYFGKNSYVRWRIVVLLHQQLQFTVHTNTITVAVFYTTPNRVFNSLLSPGVP